MATPNEQHGARGRAHVVGSANQDGREPLAESADARAASQRSLDAAAAEPRTGQAETPTVDADVSAEEVHRPPGSAPSQDNTDVRA